VRVLILGVGVIGSFNAARFKEAGHDVTLPVRGQRLEDLREHGILLEDFRAGRRSTAASRSWTSCGPTMPTTSPS